MKSGMNLKSLFLCAAIICLIHIKLISAGTTEYSEYLSIYPLDNKLSQIFALFQFKFEYKFATDGEKNRFYGIGDKTEGFGEGPQIITNKFFPIPFLQLAAKYTFDFYDVTLTQGVWDGKIKDLLLKYVNNIPLVQHSIGLQIYEPGLTFFSSPNASVDPILNTLSGILSAGTKPMKEHCSVINPVLDLDPPTQNPSKSRSKNAYKYMSLPSQFVCKENTKALMEYIKIIESGGLGYVYSPDKLAKAMFKFIKVVQVKTERSIELHFLIGHDIEKGIQFLDGLKGKVRGCMRCKITEGIFIHKTGREVVDLREGLGNFVHMLNTTGFNTPPIYIRPLSITRQITNPDFERFAEYVSVLKNNGEKRITFLFQEYIPYFLKPYFHKLNITSSIRGDILPIVHSVDNPHIYIDFDSQKNCYFKIFGITINAGEMLTIRLEIEKRVLLFEDYPNDASRGFELRPMPLFYYEGEEGNMDDDKSAYGSILNIGQNEIIYKGRTDWGVIYSNGLLVMIPQPDFSMPFNVIAITSTVASYFFVNLVTIVMF